MNYRKKWESYYGRIPDNYEIHHIDGNKHNNDIINLKCVSIEEHFNIHLSQEDFGASAAILIRMNTSKKELSALLSKAQKIRMSKPESRNHLRKMAIKQFNDPIKRQNHKKACIEKKCGHDGTIWINDGINNKRIYPSDLIEYEKNDWIKGRLLGEIKFFNHGNRNRDLKTGRYLKKGEK